MDGAELEVRRTVETVTLEIQTLQRQANQVVLGYAIEIGRRLVEVKAMLPHGQWGDYLRHEVAYSPSTAQNFMRIFEEYGASQQSLFGGEANSQALGNLSYTKALRLLVLPGEEREAFVAEHDVEAMSTRELEAALRARAEAEAARTSAEEARAQMERDMQAANALLAGARRENAEAAEREASLRAELEALRARPVEAAGTVEPDASALEAARQEGAKAARAEVERQVKSRLNKAEAEAKAAREKLAQAEAESAGLKKRLKTDGSPEIAAFGAYFEQAKEAFNRMTGLLLKLGNAGAPEAGKLANALRALLEAMGRQLPDERGGNAE